MCSPAPGQGCRGEVLSRADLGTALPEVGVAESDVEQPSLGQAHQKAGMKLKVGARDTVTETETKTGARGPETEIQRGLRLRNLGQN